MRRAAKGKKLFSHPKNFPDRIYGVDFSGAANAAKRIWITHGVIKGDSLWIKDCQRAETMLGSVNDRNKCMEALRNFIVRERTSAFGMDFPFGLPRDLVKEDSWEDFVLSFPNRYTSAEEFRKVLYTSSCRSELKRTTDRENQTPFSPYNLRLFRQTFFGIRDVLFPLVQKNLVCVLPMQKILPGRTWLLEVCPASTLKREHLYSPYKGRTKLHYKARVRILAWVKAACAVPLPNEVQLAALEDYNGDAIDSMIATFATFRTLRNRSVIAIPDNNAYMMEGYVYV